MTSPSFLCSVCKKNKAVKKEYCKDCLKVVTIDMVHLIDKEVLEGTAEQQREAWNLYVQQYSELKERFV